ncbi:MAG: helix-turn-helix domain-containing protein, partial [Dongiaceae bacterium]
MDIPPSLGDWVRRRRKALDLTREELARRVGCSVPTLRKIEADERRPSKPMAERLAECLEVPLEDRPLFLQVARRERRVEALGRLSAPSGVPGSAAAPRVSLPVPATPLVGRGFELAEIHRLLHDPQCRLLTLTGPGGIGKTRLAIAAAADQREAFADGASFVSLASLSSPEFMVPAMADA